MAWPHPTHRIALPILVLGACCPLLFLFLLLRNRGAGDTLRTRRVLSAVQRSMTRMGLHESYKTTRDVFHELPIVNDVSSFDAELGKNFVNFIRGQGSGKRRF